MRADRADLRRRRALADIAAVQALPDDLFVLLEDFVLLDVGEQQLIALLMLFLDLADGLEEGGDLREAFLAGGLGEAGVHARPLFMFAGGGILQVRGRLANALYELEPDLGMLLLVIRCLLEDIADLYETVFLRLGRIVRILIACLRFTGKSGPKILLGLGSF